MKRAPAGDRPRLVFIVTSHITAGAFLPGITQYLHDVGWDVTVVCSPGEGVDRLAEQTDVDIVTLALERDPNAPADVKALVSLVGTLRRIAPDVVLTATPKAGLLGTTAARITRVPNIVHLMWGLRSETLHGARRAMVRLLEGVATRFSHRVVACSPSLRGEIVQARMARPSRVIVLGAGSSHGVDLVRFQPSTEGAPPGWDGVAAQLDALGQAPVIGFIGRLTPDKGIDALLGAARRLHTAGRSFRLLLVGAVEDGTVAARVEEARDAGLPLVLTQSNHDALPPYHLMDIHCLPTLREGFPNVSLEASACGIPTVTTDATGAVDSVRHEVTGLIAAKDDAESLARALDILLGDREMRLGFGHAARRWVEEEFEETLVWQRHEQHLRGMLVVSGISRQARRHRPARRTGAPSRRR